MDGLLIIDPGLVADAIAGRACRARTFTREEIERFTQAADRAALDREALRFDQAIGREPRQAVCFLAATRQSARMDDETDSTQPVEDRGHGDRRGPSYSTRTPTVTIVGARSP